MTPYLTWAWPGIAVTLAVMVSPSRSSSSARGREDAGKLFLGALVLLGLVASALLVLSDSVQFTRVGLVVALWAAVLGAWVVSRYQTRVRDLRYTYELELEREISARREHDLGVEARVRSEVGADATEMTALRAELGVLRRQLERLFEGGLPPERPVLHASAFRVQELPAAQSESEVAGPWPDPQTGERHAVDAWANAAADWSYAADGWVDPAANDARPATGETPTGESVAADSATAEPGADSGAVVSGERSTVTPVYENDYPGRPQFASPDDAPVTAETAIVRLDDDPPRAPDISGPSWSDAFTEVDAAPGSQACGPPHPMDFFQGPPTRQEVVHGPPAPDGGPVASTDRPPSPDTAEAREHRTVPKLSARSVSSRRRLTQAEPGGSRRLSVAEIMANLRREEEQRSS